jgi:acyl-CoA reductase-like NAD-dependent aldehyde dehydrogenase
MTTESHAPEAPADAPIRAQMLIGGEAVDAADGQTFELVNPATGRGIGTAALGGKADVDRAVDAATKAFEDRKGWANWAAGKRGRTLAKYAALVKQHSDELAGTETRNMGKAITNSRGEAVGVSLVLDYYAGAANKVFGETIPVGRPGIELTLREPIGVVGAIVPWNFPMYMASWKLGPALAAGNTMILKPASSSPLTAIRLGELALEAGIPEGVLEIVVGKGSVVGQRLVEHPDVAKIGFTGSTEVGRGVMQGAAGTIKRVTLELGGKSANVVFADADIEQAAAAAPYAVFDNAGQDCCARSRILVERPAMDRFMDALEEAVDALKVGDPLDESTEMGPLISAGQRETVSSFVPDDAPIAIRGSAPDGPGFWFPPTVLCPVAPTDRAATEEIFGPVATVIPFDDEAEAIRLANDTIYGLSGSIWTRNGARALRAARAIESGNLSLNSNSSVRVTTPFGGFKQSGYGRELGPHALDHYTEVKTVFYATEE